MEWYHWIEGYFCLAIPAFLLFWSLVYVGARADRR